MARRQRRLRILSSGTVRFLALIALLIALLWASASDASTPDQWREDSAGWVTGAQHPMSRARPDLAAHGTS
jgi:hypothetical protein